MMEKAHPTTVSIDLIDVKPQIRQKMEDDENKLSDLALSIKAHGVISPILLRVTPGGRYGLVAGERRLQASKLAGLKTIPCLIKTLTDVQVEEIQFVENIHRLNLTQMEEARALKAALDGVNGNQQLLAKKFGKSTSWVSLRLNLLTLGPEAKRLMTEGASADVSTIVAIKTVEKIDPAGAKRLVDEAVATKGQGGSLRKTVEQAVKDVKTTGKVAATTTKPAIGAAAKSAAKAGNAPSMATPLDKSHQAPGLPFVIAKSGQSVAGSIFPAAPVKPHERVITALATALAAPKATPNSVMDALTMDDAKIANAHALPFFKRGKSNGEDIIEGVIKGLRTGDFGKDPISLFNLLAFAQGIDARQTEISDPSLLEILSNLGVA